MDPVLALLFGLLILAIIVGAAFLRPWLNRSAAASGRRAGERFARAQLDRALAEFGITLRIPLPVAEAQELLAQATANGKDFLPLPDGDIGIRFVEPDDTVVRVAPDPEGALVRVETFREYMGFPQTTALWTDLRSRIRAVAGARGLTVSDGPPVSYVRGPLLDDRNARWSRTG